MIARLSRTIPFVAWTLILTTRMLSNCDSSITVRTTIMITSMCLGLVEAPTVATSSKPPKPLRQRPESCQEAPTGLVKPEGLADFCVDGLGEAYEHNPLPLE